MAVKRLRHCATASHFYGGREFSVGVKIVMGGNVLCFLQLNVRRVFTCGR